MTGNKQDWGARRRRELDRDRDARRRSQAIAGRRGVNAERTDRAGITADRFGPSDPRYAYLTRVYD
jgi:hypothetical protein